MSVPVERFRRYSGDGLAPFHPETAPGENEPFSARNLSNANLMPA